MITLEDNINNAGSLPSEAESVEELVSSYRERDEQRTDDIIAAQTVICILAAAGFFVLNLMLPDTAVPLFAKLRELAGDSREIMPNLIGLALSFCGK